eukprot:CAMPEP_0194441048 /NCGR_PEP_ID=MMETSP0176-20130528/119427_1 /TAXON_ID=216777 /ORGANISM="Proboscia alata, Strain PI-D3" /LENGTH=168 /DNA_ID=CAMNT_0039265977 /DNA_START=145 /DNA_END=651 /DNA_ORIENTATION=+
MTTMALDLIQNISAKDMILLGVFIPGGIAKVAMPKVFKEKWPKLPSWFWIPCGAWSITFTLLVTSVLDVPSVGFPGLFMFMGGVFCSILHITDTEGHTMISGKSKSGSGIPPLFVATTSTLLLLSMDDRMGESSPKQYFYLMAFICLCLGFNWGAFLTKGDGKKESVD